MTRKEQEEMNGLRAINARQAELLTESISRRKKIESDQLNYEQSLRAEIERIQLLGPWKRFWGSVELFKNLFEVIQGGFKE